MKKVVTSFDEKEKVYITSFGFETNHKKACWGRGSRNETIIHYVLKGKGFVNGVSVNEGEGFYLPKNKVHEYYSSSENPWSYFWVVLNGDASDEFLNRFIKYDENGIFLYDFKDRLTLFCNDFFKENKKISQVKGMGIFLLIMSYHEKTKDSSGNKYVEEAKKYMECNIHRNLSIKEISDFLHISDRYLYNLFIEYEKISPKQYFSNLKLKYALKYLKESDMNITEIANSLGYSDVFAFSRFFSLKTGVSPKKYKN